MERALFGGKARASACGWQGGKARWVQAAAGLAVGFSLGLKAEALEAALESWQAAAKMRQEVKALHQGWAILDAYNASPQSMQAGLDFLAASAPRGQRCAVLGCMLELGASAAGPAPRLWAAKPAPPAGVLPGRPGRARPRDREGLRRGSRGLPQRRGR